MAKKDKKAEPSPTIEVAKEVNYAKPDRKDGHPWRGTGEGNPRHANLKKRCKATNSREEQCSLPPMRGQEVCGSHGGRAGQSLAKGRERLDMLADPAVVVLHRLLEESEDEAIQYKVAIAILDRTGMSPRHALSVTHNAPKFESILTEIVRVSEDDDNLDPAIQELRESTGDDRY